MSQIKLYNLNERNQLFQELSHSLEKHLSETLFKLTGQEINVRLTSANTKRNPQTIGIGERCFGSYISFSGPAKGFIIIFFPLNNISPLLEMVDKQLFGSKKRISSKVKLSAFKEIISILLGAYITEISNSLGIELRISPPTFKYFRMLELKKIILSKMRFTPSSLISYGKLHIGSKDITGGGIVIF